MVPTDSQELTSWKDIAEHLGVNVRTAQRWEAEKGLPVRRLGGSHGRVLASTAELDAWRRAASQRSNWWNDLRVVRAYAVAVTGILLVAGALSLTLYLDFRAMGSPSGFQVTGNGLVVTDQNGRELWRRSFAETPDPEQYLSAERRNRVWLGRIEPSGGVNTLFVLAPILRASKGDTFHCFSERGLRRWEFHPGRKALEGSREFSALYHVRGFRVFPSPARDGTMWIAVSSVHHRLHPCQVAILDNNGRLLGEYWHLGRLDVIEVADINGDGLEEILLAGVDEVQRRATLVVLEPRRIAGSRPLQAAAPSDLANLPKGIERAVVLFPRTSLNRKLEQFNSAYEVALVDGSIQVLVKEHMQGDPPYLLYTFRKDLNLVSVEASVSLRNRYRDLKATRLLDQELSDAELEALRQGVEVFRH